MKNPLKRCAAAMLDGLGLLRLSGWLRTRLLARPRITILCYHRITDRGAMISPQCIPPKMFDAQIRYLSSHYRILSLDEVEKYLRGDFLLAGDAIVVTFDDGYQDNFTEALPVLERYNVKACFFVASAPLLDGRCYWIDELSALLEAIHGGNAVVSLTDMPTIARQISEFVNAPVSVKQAQAKAIFLEVNRLDEQQKHTMLTALRAACQAAGCTPGITPALMTPEQLDALARTGQDIGGHTVTHPRLSNLEQVAVGREITNGLDQLRQRVGKVHYFAYPFGKLADIPTDRTALFATLEAAGVAMAVTTDDGVVVPGDHRYWVPRTVMSAQSLAQTRLKLERLAWQR